MNEHDVTKALRRSEQVLCEQVSQQEPFEFGTAHHAPSLPARVEANQLRDVWLAETTAESVFDRAEEHYRSCGARCLAWVPAAAQPLEPLQAFLGGKGWRRQDKLAMGLASLEALRVRPKTLVAPPSRRCRHRRDACATGLLGRTLNGDAQNGSTDPSPKRQRGVAEQSPKRKRGVITPAGDKPVACAPGSDPSGTIAHGSKDSTPTAELRVLPGRAMRNAYRSLLAAAGGGAPPVDLAFERLNDSNYDVFVAMDGQDVAGCVGYLEAGDIARLTDLFVLPAFRGRGVGRALTAHFLQIVRRLLPRVVVACVAAGDDSGRAFLERCGFSAAGVLTEFHRPEA